MAEYKKHHYIPKFYMKLFSEDDTRINMFNLKSQKIIEKIPLKGQCYEDYFYGKDLILEHNLGDWEGIWAEILRGIILTNNLPPVDSSEYFMFIFFILIQSSRTKYSVDSLIHLIESMSKEIFDAETTSEEEFIKNEYGIENIPHFYISVAVDSYPLLFDLKCKILKNHTDTEFVLSDNPIVFYNQLMSFRKGMNNIGTSSKGLQIFFPISPDTSILFYDDDVYKVGRYDHNIIEIRNEQDIYQINTLQVCSAYENIYFENNKLNLEALYKKSEPYFRTVKSNIKAFPKENSNKIEKLIMTSIEEVRTNLQLSFLTIKKISRDWVKEFQKKKHQPVVVYRNEELKKHYDEFNIQVDSGKYEKQDFLKFCKDKKFSFSNNH